MQWERGLIVARLRVTRPMQSKLAVPAPACLALHGLGGGPYELEPLTAALEAEGFRVAAPILPGHERVGRIMPSSTWRAWADASEAAFDVLAERGGPVVVIGFSTGGTLALRLATRRPVARMVLLAPFLAIRYSRLIPLRPASYLRHFARVIPNLPRRGPALRDRAMRRWVSGQSRFRTFSLHATLSALELIAEVEALVSAITTPTLIIQGTRDTVVEPFHARWLHDHLGATTKAYVGLPRSDHLIALDHDRAQAIAAAVDFVRDGTLPH